FGVALKSFYFLQFLITNKKVCFSFLKKKHYSWIYTEKYIFKGCCYKKKYKMKHLKTQENDRLIKSP
ncbi:MAG: hypothetical protein ACFFFY_12160, partial [Promethearchaeota archaeon]